MKKVVSTERIPIKLWLNDIEEGALEQAKNVANLPFAYRHVALMPDCHVGYSLPIGGVAAFDNVISPACVGFDIGCGMCAVKTPLTEISENQLKAVMGQIRQRVPVGKGIAHFDMQDNKYMPEFFEVPKMGIIYEDNALYNNARKQLGTLGAGNHFCEIQKGSDGYIWIMIHSGSRKLGHTVAGHYDKIAKDLNRKWHSNVDAKSELAFLPIDSEEGQAYLIEMDFCLRYAFANRKLMMEQVLFGINKGGLNVYDGAGFNSWSSGLDYGIDVINIHHNYAALENHFGRNVMIHRKGATLARENTIGIVPGSQGTKSYIVKGKGNSESFMSCSHGAGRKMSRAAAKRDLDLETEKKRLDDQGIFHAIRGEKDLDEASGAYKDIAQVMKNQEDLVEILVELSPLAVVKG